MIEETTEERNARLDREHEEWLAKMTPIWKAKRRRSERILLGALAALIIWAILFVKFGQSYLLNLYKPFGYEP